MKIYTGYFAKVKTYQNAGLVPISIARSAKYYNGLSYIQLAPPYWLIKQSEKIYVPEFMKLLSTLKPLWVYEELKRLSNNRDIILLCHEKAGDFCHRHLVADWLNVNLKLDIMEFQEKKAVIIEQKSLF